jgi:ribosomal protein S18 acetylase RimI-like enzyme
LQSWSLKTKLWRSQTKPLEEYLLKRNQKPISEKIEGKNAIFVAEEDGKIVGLCWCTAVDRGVDKQGELAEFYVEKEFRGRGIGADLIASAKQFFVDEKVEVAFVWAHRGNQAAIELYRGSGFKEVTQIVMAFVPAKNS